jgi:hypothetical protein
MTTHIGTFGNPIYNIDSPALRKFRKAGKFLQEYAETLEKVIRAKQRAELQRELPTISPSCASRTWYTTGAEIHKAVRQQQRTALLAYPSKVRCNRTDDEWEKLYRDAMGPEALERQLNL